MISSAGAFSFRIAFTVPLLSEVRILDRLALPGYGLVKSFSGLHSQGTRRHKYLIIVDAVIQSYCFRKAGGSSSSRDLDHINLSVFFNEITIYGTVIQSHRTNGKLYLAFCLFSQLSCFSREPNAYRSGHIALKGIYIIRKQYKSLPSDIIASQPKVLPQ
mgnify:CR=1 FL=1